MAKASVIAGLMCASLLPKRIAVKMPQSTANAQPAVMTIQPAFSALLFFSSTPATTPSPSRISIIVPMNSPSIAECIRSLYFLSGIDVGVVLKHVLRGKFAEGAYLRVDPCGVLAQFPCE